MAGVFIAQTASGVRVAVTGAGSGVFRWTEAEQALAKKMDAAALEKLALATDDLNEDIHGSREYRAQLVKVMAGRAVAAINGKQRDDQDHDHRQRHQKFGGNGNTPA